jgi:hypothetical protein
MSGVTSHVRRFTITPAMLAASWVGFPSLPRRGSAGIHDGNSERLDVWSSRLRRTAAATLGVLLAAPAVAMACPSCKSAIENDPVAAAFNSTTILMIAVPVVLVASVGGWIFYAHWRARRALDAGVHAAVVWRPAWTEKESET